MHFRQICDPEEPVRDEVAANLRLWDGWTDLHMSGTDYDVEGFVAVPSPALSTG